MTRHGESSTMRPERVRLTVTFDASGQPILRSTQTGVVGLLGADPSRDLRRVDRRDLVAPEGLSERRVSLGLL